MVSDFTKQHRQRGHSASNRQKFFTSQESVLCLQYRTYELYAGVPLRGEPTKSPSVDKTEEGKRGGLRIRFTIPAYSLIVPFDDMRTYMFPPGTALADIKSGCYPVSGQRQNEACEGVQTGQERRPGRVFSLLLHASFIAQR